MNRRITTKVNGVWRHVDTDPEKPLFWMLHENLGLTGTQLGCAAGTCGGCVVQVNGVAQRACMLIAADVEGADVVTVEAFPLELAEAGAT